MRSRLPRKCFSTSVRVGLTGVVVTIDITDISEVLFTFLEESRLVSLLDGSIDQVPEVFGVHEGVVGSSASHSEVTHQTLVAVAVQIAMEMLEGCSVVNFTSILRAFLR